MLVELTRQPARHWRALADDFTDAKDGLQPAMIDPSHGTLLIQEGLRPNLRERVEPGCVIAYVIIVFGRMGQCWRRISCCSCCVSVAVYARSSATAWTSSRLN